MRRSGEYEFCKGFMGAPTPNFRCCASYLVCWQVNSSPWRMGAWSTGRAGWLAGWLADQLDVFDR